MNKKYLSVITGFLVLFFAACDVVEDGYTVEYGESDAELSVEAIGLASAAPGEVISLRIEVRANSVIKSCLVDSKMPGATGSGFDVGTAGFDDPFADHNYGTIKKDIQSFLVKYDYVVPEEGVSTGISVTIVEEEAKVADTLEVEVVLPVVKYKDVVLYAKDNLNNDAFASISGIVYPDIKTNFSQVTEANVSVQEDIDMIFYVQDGVPILASTAYPGVRLSLEVENETKFKRMTAINEDDFENVTAAALVEMVKEDSIAYYGDEAVSNIQVGDIIAFETGINAKNSAKSGLLKIKQLHPASITRYEGRAYVMECDILTQIEK